MGKLACFSLNKQSNSPVCMWSGQWHVFTRVNIVSTFPPEQWTLAYTGVSMDGRSRWKWNIDGSKPHVLTVINNVYQTSLTSANRPYQYHIPATWYPHLFELSTFPWLAQQVNSSGGWEYHQAPSFHAAYLGMHAGSTIERQVTSWNCLLPVLVNHY